MFKCYRTFLLFLLATLVSGGDASAEWVISGDETVPSSVSEDAGSGNGITITGDATITVDLGVSISSSNNAGYGLDNSSGSSVVFQGEGGNSNYFIATGNSTDIYNSGTTSFNGMTVYADTIENIGSLTISSDALDNFYFNNGIINNYGDFTLDGISIFPSSNGLINNDGGVLTITSVDGSAVNGAIDLENINSGTVGVTGSQLILRDVTNTSGSMGLSGGSLDASGDITNNDTMTFTNTDVTASNFTNTSGSMGFSSGSLDASSNITNNDTMTFTDMDVTASNVTNAAGYMEFNDGSLDASGDITNTAGSMEFKSLSLEASGDITNNDTMTFTSTGVTASNVTNTAGAMGFSGGSLEVGSNITNNDTMTFMNTDVTASNVTNTAGSMEFSRGSLEASGNITNNDIMTFANTDVTVLNIDNSGTMTVVGNGVSNVFEVLNGGYISNTGDLSVTEMQLNVDADTISNDVGTLILEGADGLTNAVNVASGITNGAGTINIANSGVRVGSLTNDGTMTITGDGVSNVFEVSTGGVVSNTGDLSVTEMWLNVDTNTISNDTGTLTLVGLGGVTNSLSFSNGISNGIGVMDISNTSVTVGGGDITNDGTMTITGDGVSDVFSAGTNSVYNNGLSSSLTIADMGLEDANLGELHNEGSLTITGASWHSNSLGFGRMYNYGGGTVDISNTSLAVDGIDNDGTMTITGDGVSNVFTVSNVIYNGQNGAGDLTISGMIIDIDADISNSAGNVTISGVGTVASNTINASSITNQGELMDLSNVTINTTNLDNYSNVGFDLSNSSLTVTTMLSNSSEFTATDSSLSISELKNYTSFTATNSNVNMGGSAWNNDAGATITITGNGSTSSPNVMSGDGDIQNYGDMSITGMKLNLGELGNYFSIENTGTLTLEGISGVNNTIVADKTASSYSGTVYNSTVYNTGTMIVKNSSLEAGTIENYGDMTIVGDTDMSTKSTFSAGDIYGVFNYFSGTMDVSGSILNVGYNLLVPAATFYNEGVVSLVGLAGEANYVSVTEFINYNSYLSPITTTITNSSFNTNHLFNQLTDFTLTGDALGDSVFTIGNPGTYPISIESYYSNMIVTGMTLNIDANDIYSNQLMTLTGLATKNNNIKAVNISNAMVVGDEDGSAPIMNITNSSINAARLANEAGTMTVTGDAALSTLALSGEGAAAAKYDLTSYYSLENYNGTMNISNMKIAITGKAATNPASLYNYGNLTINGRAGAGNSIVVDKFHNHVDKTQADTMGYVSTFATSTMTINNTSIEANYLSNTASAMTLTGDGNGSSVLTITGAADSVAFKNVENSTMNVSAMKLAFSGGKILNSESNMMLAALLGKGSVVNVDGIDNTTTSTNNSTGNLTILNSSVASKYLSNDKGIVTLTGDTNGSSVFGLSGSNASGNAIENNDTINVSGMMLGVNTTGDVVNDGNLELAGLLGHTNAVSVGTVTNAGSASITNSSISASSMTNTSGTLSMVGTSGGSDTLTLTAGAIDNFGTLTVNNLDAFAANSNFVHLENGSTFNWSNSDLTMGGTYTGLQATGTSTATLTNVNYSSAADLITLDSGSTINLNAANSNLSGYINGASDKMANLNLSGNSTWDIRNSSVINNITLADSGVNLRKASGNNTLTVNNWNSSNSVVFMNVNMDGNDLYGDKLIVNGSVNGTTTLNVNNTATSVNKVVDNGLMVVSAASPNANNSFSIAGGQIDDGAYVYKLYKGNTSGVGNDWYLRTQGSGPGPNPTPTPTDTFNTIIAGPALMVGMGEVAMSNLVKRLGELREFDCCKNSGAWARSYAEHMKVNSAMDSKMDLYGVEGGYDYLVNYDNNNKMFVGLMGGYLSNSNFKSDQNNGYHGRGEGYAPSVGAYATYINKEGWFADLVARHFWTDMKLTSYTAQGTPIKYDAERDLSMFSLEVGRQMAFGVDKNSKYIVEPKLQAIYSYAGDDSFRTSTGRDVEYSDTESMVGVAAVLFGYNYVAEDSKIYEPYVQFAAIQEFAGTTDVMYDGATRKDDFSGLGYEVAVGLNTQLSRSWAAYGDVNYRFGDVFENYGVNLGLRYSW